MSAAEMVKFITYAPIMLGRFVPETNEYWKMFINLRQILCLLSCKHFDINWLEYLENLISEHHEQFIKLFGPLKPKHHFMLHY